MAYDHVIPHMINRLLHSRGSNANRSSGPADVRTHPCGLPQTSAPIHADVCTHPCGRPHQSMRTSAPIHADVHIDVRIDVRRLPRTSLRTYIWKYCGRLHRKKFPACVDLRTKRPNTPQTSAGKCPQFSMRNITFFADISGTGKWRAELNIEKTLKDISSTASVLISK